MSFDLYFLEAPTQGDWIEAMERLGTHAAADGRLEADVLTTWDTLVEQVRDLLPGAETVECDTYRELVHEATGLQLSLHPGELSLSIPYWYRGSGADETVELLRTVVASVEEITGLTAYDPQAEAPFLDGGSSRASATFAMVDKELRTGVTPPPAPRRTPWFRRWFG